MTYAAAAALIPVAILPAFTRTVLTAILASFDSAFDGLLDGNGSPTDNGINTLVPLVGSTKLDTWIATKYIVDECRIAMGLPLNPDQNPY